MVYNSRTRKIDYHFIDFLEAGVILWCLFGATAVNDDFWLPLGLAAIHILQWGFANSDLPVRSGINFLVFMIDLVAIVLQGFHYWTVLPTDIFPLHGRAVKDNRYEIPSFVLLLFCIACCVWRYTNICDDDVDNERRRKVFFSPQRMAYQPSAPPPVYHRPPPPPPPPSHTFYQPHYQPVYYQPVAE